MIFAQLSPIESGLVGSIGSSGALDTASLLNLSLPIETFSISYKNLVEPKTFNTESVGMFSHPPYVSWKGGEVGAVTIKTKLAAGGFEVATPSVPTIATAHRLVQFVELIY